MTKDVKYFENLYYVNEEQEVYSYPKSNHQKGKKLRPYDQGKGYLRVSLCKEGKVYKKDIHRIMAETFVDNPLNLPCVNHKNGIKSDNRLVNLEWCTYLRNRQHAIETGLMKFKKGYENKRSLFTPEQINEIRRLKIPQSKIAEIYNVAQCTISKIVTRRRY